MTSEHLCDALEAIEVTDSIAAESEMPEAPARIRVVSQDEGR
jgi:hypothetical protein